MEHMSEQSHRWDLQSIEADSAKHNMLAKKEFTKYIKYNPRDEDKRTEQLEGFNEHRQRVIDDYETWTGVPESLKCKLRDTSGKLTPWQHGN